MRKTKLMVSAAALSMMAALALTGCGGGKHPRAPLLTADPQRAETPLPYGHGTLP